MRLAVGAIAGTPFDIFPMTTLFPEQHAANRPSLRGRLRPQSTGPVKCTAGLEELRDLAHSFLLYQRTVAYVRNFQVAATLYDRWAARVEVSTEHADFFVRNLVAILAEERIGLAVKQLLALTYGDFGNVA
jgi:hypothetical protein